MNSMIERSKKLAESLLFRAVSVLTVSVMLVTMLGGATVSKYSILIEDETVQTVVFTSESEPEAILKAGNISISEYDTFTFTGFADDNRATMVIHRAAEVTVTADGETKTVWMQNGTAADALHMAGVPVGEEDLLNVALGEKVADGMHIVLNRVTYETVEKEEEIPYPTEHKPTPTMKKGTTRLAKPGKNGVMTQTVQQKLIDGVVVEEEVLSEEVTVKPIAERILVGAPGTVCSTLGCPIELDENGNPVEYKYKVTGKATAYSSLGRPTKLVQGKVAMDLSKFPRGTKLYIKTADGSFVYGYSAVGDTGTAVCDGRVLVDLFFDNYQESVLFGAKKVEVYVLS